SGDETLGLLPDDRVVLLGNAGRIAVEIDAGRVRILRRSTRSGRSRAADDRQGGSRRARCRGNDGRTKIFLHARSPELHGVRGRRSVFGARRARSDRKGEDAILANRPAPPSRPRRSVGPAAPDRASTIALPGPGVSARASKTSPARRGPRCPPGSPTRAGSSAPAGRSPPWPPHRGGRGSRCGGSRAGR